MIEQQQQTVQMKSSEICALPESLTKQLLQDFETSGEDREDYNLLEYCERKKFLFGEAATLLRRQTQYRWNQAKQKSWKNYGKFLFKHSVLPGEKSSYYIRVANFDNMPPKRDKKSSLKEEKKDAESAVDSDSDSTSPSKYQEPDQKMPAKSSENEVKWQGDPPNSPIPDAVSFAGIGSPGLSPMVSQNYNNNSHMFGRTSGLGGQPPLMPSLPSQETDPRYLVPHIWLANMDGSSEWPWIVKVKPETPEKHLDGFCISYASDMKLGNYEYEGFHVRKSTSIPDRKKWRGWIPATLPPEFKHRAIAISGPAVDFWLSDATLYHKGKFKVDCASTLKAHKKTQQALRKDKSRQDQYYILIWEKGVKLDPSVFSQGSENVPTTSNPLKCPNNIAGNTSGRELLGMTVFWKIAAAGGQQVDSEETKDDSEMW
jgi:hypothetical protein